MRLLWGIILLLSIPTAAHAQTCYNHTELLKSLKDQHAEKLVGRGTSHGMIIELFVNSKTGSWTLFYTRPNGVSCPIATGFNWEKTRSGKDT